MAELSRLPGTNTDHWDWQMDAACRGENSEVFFHPEGERGAARVIRTNRAKAVCAECPVRQACLDHALTKGEHYGICGGKSARERARLTTALGLPYVPTPRYFPSEQPPRKESSPPSSRSTPPPCTEPSTPSSTPNTTSSTGKTA